MTSLYLKKLKSQKAGKYAETFAALLLRLKGYTIKQRNWQSPFGELDIIAQRGDTLVFIEVKYRTSIDQGLYSITPHKQKRLINGAADYMRKHYRHLDISMRFDIIIIVKNLSILPIKWQHIKNALYN